MAQSTTIIAFDQHAATTVAAVLLPGHRTPALHPMTSDPPTLGRFVERLRRQGPVQCCYEAGPCGFDAAALPGRPPDSVRRDRAGADSAAAGRPHQDRSPGCGPVGRPVSLRGAHRHSHPHGAGGSRARPAALSRRHPRGLVTRPSSPVQVPPPARPALHRDRTRGRDATTRGCGPRPGRCRRWSRRIRRICARSMKPWPACARVEADLRALLDLEPLRTSRPSAPLFSGHR